MRLIKPFNPHAPANNIGAKKETAHGIARSIGAHKNGQPFVRSLLFASSPGGVVVECHALDQERRFDITMVHCCHASFARVERTNVPLTASRNSLSRGIFDVWIEFNGNYFFAK